VIGLGKIAGREFTYHSDLDLVFLHPGGVEALADASRTSQRMIAYLTTMTGAGIAYAVDTRLRPSGRQGALVTSLAAFEHYQTRQAQVWEHLALLRSPAIAGEVERGRPRSLVARVLAAPFRGPTSPTCASASAGGQSPRRTRRSDQPRGLMDVDFLAGGGLLEQPRVCRSGDPGAARASVAAADRCARATMRGCASLESGALARRPRRRGGGSRRASRSSPARRAQAARRGSAAHLAAERASRRPSTGRRRERSRPWRAVRAGQAALPIDCRPPPLRCASAP
jgi:hypothetical protein